LVFAPVGAWLALQKGRTALEGAIVGGVLGILGILVIGLAPAQRGQTRTCPKCAEQVLAAATVCRYCGTELEPVPVQAARSASPLTLVLLALVAIGLVYIAANASGFDYFF